MGASKPSNASSAAAARIQLVDLAAQQQRIRPALDRAIARVLDHGRYIMGPEVGELEQRLATFCGARHAIACASGTDALLIALMAKGVGPGDAVLCPAFTYTATPETIALIGATPVFVDVDEATFNIDPTTIGPAVRAARKLGLDPAAVIAVDLFGLPADYARLQGEAEAAGLWILADAAQSFGASAGGVPVGRHGLITATSFFPAKPLGCYGDGGALFTEDDALAGVMRSIRTHGNTPRDKYEIVRIGINGRLDTIQAAVLLEKLAIFPGEIAARQRVAQRYGEGLQGVAVTPVTPAGMTSVWAQYTIRVAADRRDGLVAALDADGIATGVYYPRPLHHQAAYRHFPAAGSLARSERLCGEVLSLPMHPYLSEADQDRVIEAVRRNLMD